MKAVQIFGRLLIAAFFVVAGFNHFRVPRIYEAMIPPWLPEHTALNFISGAAEIIGGVALLIPVLRPWAGYGLILLLVLIFPANVYVALQGHMEGFDFPAWVLWARLPFQLVFIGWVWWTSQPSDHFCVVQRRS